MPNQLTIWDDSESEHDDEPKYSGGGNLSRCGGGGPSASATNSGGNGNSGMGAGSSSDAHLERGCSDLFEDDEDSEAAPR